MMMLIRSRGAQPLWAHIVVDLLMLILLAAVAVGVCGCFITRPDLYGTHYMRREWSARASPAARTAYEEAQLCDRWARHQPLASNEVPGSLLFADGAAWHCYSWPMKITSDPGAGR